MQTGAGCPAVFLPLSRDCGDGAGVQSPGTCEDIHSGRVRTELDAISLSLGFGLVEGNESKKLTPSFLTLELFEMVGLKKKICILPLLCLCHSRKSLSSLS